MFRLLKLIYHFYLFPGKLIRPFKIKCFNFIFPNLRFLISKRIVYKSLPTCGQRTYLTGSGKVEIGDKCSFGFKLGGFYRGGSIEIQPRYNDSFIKIGNNVSTNNNIFICSANYIEIGDDSILGQYICIMDSEGHSTESDKRRQSGKIGKVIIGKNVWIGNNVTILKNSEIGDNSILAAGAVVSGKFPSDVIIGGVPAKVIKSL